MLLKRKIFHDCTGNPRVQKAVSLALLLKHRLGRTSTLHNWSTNKLHDVAGVSASTIKKYMPIMKSMGLVHFCGKNNQHLVVSKISSHTAHRNICIDEFCFDTFKDIYNSLRAFIALAVQARKDFIRRTIQTYLNPANHKVFIKARKTLKRLVKIGVLSGVDAEYKEYGLSYKRIAQEIGVCIRTAQRVVKYAVGNGWCRKHQNKEAYELRGVSFRDTGEIFTYATKHWVVQMHANTYSLSRLISDSISRVGIYSW